MHLPSPWPSGLSVIAGQHRTRLLLQHLESIATAISYTSLWLGWSRPIRMPLGRFNGSSTPGTSRSVLKMHTWILTRAFMTTWSNHDQQKVACSHVATVTFCIRNCPRNVCYTSLASTFAYLFKSNAVGIVFVTRQHTLSIAVLITNTSMDARKLDSAVCLHASCVSTMFLTFVAIFVRNLSESSLPRFTCLRPVHALFCIC